MVLFEGGAWPQYCGGEEAHSSSRSEGSVVEPRPGSLGLREKRAAVEVMGLPPPLSDPSPPLLLDGKGEGTLKTESPPQSTSQAGKEGLETWEDKHIYKIKKEKVGK